MLFHVSAVNNAKTVVVKQKGTLVEVWVGLKTLQW